MLTGVVFGHDQLAEVEAAGAQVVRFDVPHDTSENPQWIHDILYLFSLTNLKPWPVFHHVEHVDPVMTYAVSLRGADWVLPSMFNEPDLSNDALIDEFPPDGVIPHEVFINHVSMFRDICRKVGHEGLILAGGISNLNDRGFTYLSKIAPFLPSDCGQEFHLYPDAYQIPWLPHKGEGTSHQAGIKKFRSIIGRQRPSCCGEFGFNMAARDPFPRYTEHEIYMNLIDWFRMFDEELDHEGVACVYQWKDGDTDNAMGRYGLHHYDGTPKEQLKALKDWRN